MSEIGPPVRIFISHSGADDDFGTRLVHDLRNVPGLQDAVWYDSQGGLSGGTSWWSTIMQEIRSRNTFLVILSPDAMSSEWVKAEVTIAWQQMLSQNGIGKVMIPLLYRSCEVRADLKTLHIISFEAPRPYQDALAQLLLTLQTPIPTSSQNFAQFQQGQTTQLPTAEPLLMWTVPFRRNPLFTGRETILIQLYQNLISRNTQALTQAWAINGMGGIGKTQIAVEYAYRYREHYRYVLWLRAATSYDLLQDLAHIAQLLDLPIKNESNQHHIATTVKHWLEQHGNWLLIFDNADDLATITDFLPQSNQGHILLTTQAQATGRFTKALPIEKMSLQEGVLLLLRRAKHLEHYTLQDHTLLQSHAEAEAIVHEVDGLPLAIDQIGAYIEETQYSLGAYLKLYRTHRKALLRRRSSLPTDHPEPVASTWALSFQNVDQANPAAADLLRLCAFLDPDAIPEELLTRGASQLGPLLEAVAANEFLLNEAIEVLLKYSLVKRNSDAQVISVHRLVQAVLKDEMNEETQRQWAKRTVQVVAQSLPLVDMARMISWQLYLPHATICAVLIDQYNFLFAEGVQLLNRTASFLRRCALYHEAEPLCLNALKICEETLGAEHPDAAMSLNNLGMLYWYQGKYEQAEILLQQALAIREKALGEEHPDTATSLHDLGRLYRRQGKYEKAEELLQRALMIREKTLGPEHPDAAMSLNNLGKLYRRRGKDEKAEELLQRALMIREKTLGPEHPETAASLHNLGRLYRRQGKYEKAEELLQRALMIREKTLGPEHPDIAKSLDYLSKLYQDQEKYEEAEALSQRALTIHKKMQGAEHPETAMSLSILGTLYCHQRKYEKAEALWQQALTIHEKALGEEHPDTATSLNNLSLLYSAQGKYKEAELLLKRALMIFAKVLGEEHPDTTASLNDLAELYRTQGKYKEAEPLLKQTPVTREKIPGTEHPDI